MKPGGATSAEPIASGSFSSETSASAMRIGGMRAVGASCIAALVA